ncbi:AraC family transcriptional regulator [Saccharopolyspora spinosa]|uniref:AraC family transcriptional regulator n=1 Tax=Saccharopolyspora spinosa TaxID=60894 RepID=A0A2N3XW02_SACSN|nr:AraC family transcriptional regulator [Saccharopolyspora spinosa]
MPLAAWSLAPVAGSGVGAGGHHGSVSRYRERPPVGALSTAIACVWTHGAGSLGYLQRVVPDGCVDLIWMGARLDVVGPDTTARLSALPPGSRITGIRAKPGAARLLLGDIPATELRDLQVDSLDIWGSSMRDVVGRLGDEPDRAGRILEEFAFSRLSKYRPDPVLAPVVAALDAPVPPAIPALADSVGLSVRQLRRRVAAAVGYGPQTLAGVLRFQRATRLGVGSGGLAELAHASGYADQAHLTREFRRLAGVTPRQYFSPLPQNGS